MAQAWRRRRLDAAAAALSLRSTDVYNVALNAGYHSPEAFARAFKSRFGIPPSMFARHPPSKQPHLALAIGLGLVIARHLYVQKNVRATEGTR